VALERLRQHFNGFVDQARGADSLRVALAGAVATPTMTRDFAKVAADTEIFSSWVDRMKQRFLDAPSPSSNKIASAGGASNG
jgi:CO/xanthine dehydrogenase FAD-binding subunit